jgi:ABC-2 type transport system ATP-binding protein
MDQGRAAGVPDEAQEREPRLAARRRRLIEARQLTKRFGGRTAVEEVTLHVANGEVVGLLGPNGAGKSTIFRILAGIFPPDAGRALVDGHDLERDALGARRRIGYVPERPALHLERTVDAELAFVATLRDVPAGARRRAVDEVVARTGLDDVRRRRIGALSRGMRQRVSLAAGLVGEPPALLLDEPTVGLDPAQSAETRRLIRELARDRAVLVSSHILADVEVLCDRVVVLHEGRVLADGDPASLAVRLRRTTYVDVEAATDADRLRALLRGVAGVRDVAPLPGNAVEGRCRVEVATDRNVRALIAAALAGAGIALYALVPVEPSLEEAFLSLVREGDREAHA